MNIGNSLLVNRGKYWTLHNAIIDEKKKKIPSSILIEKYTAEMVKLDKALNYVK
jgi:hypothetical protein